MQVAGFVQVASVYVCVCTGFVEDEELELLDEELETGFSAGFEAVEELEEELPELLDVELEAGFSAGSEDAAEELDELDELSTGAEELSVVDELSSTVVETLE